MKIKSMPKEERPIEKAIESGISRLTNSDLLALIIRTGTGGKSAIALSQELILKDPKGIEYLAEATIEELMEITGIGKAKACSVLAAIELGKRLGSITHEETESINNADLVAKVFMESLRYEKREHFFALLLNSKGKIISKEEISIGELSSTVVHPREVFSPAIKKSAAAVIFVHNHPSGDPTPSREDVDTTKRLMEGGEILGIRVLDHIVIGNGVFKSLKKENLI